MYEKAYFSSLSLNLLR